MTDARVLRTRAALDAAIAELASHTPITAITVSELAERAGINRATFYKHFDSPGQALAAYLAAQLGPHRAEFTAAMAEPGSDPLEVYLSNAQTTLDHIEQHRDLYLTAIHNPLDGVTPNFLADHFTESARQYLEARADAAPPPKGVDLTILARFYAHGIVGAIKAWLLSGSTDRGELIGTVQHSLPEWFWTPL